MHDINLDMLILQNMAISVFALITTVFVIWSLNRQYLKILVYAQPVFLFLLFSYTMYSFFIDNNYIWVISAVFISGLFYLLGFKGNLKGNR